MILAFEYKLWPGRGGKGAWYLPVKVYTYIYIYPFVVVIFFYLFLFDFLLLLKFLTRF